MKKRTIILIISAALLIGLMIAGFYLYQSGIILPKSGDTQQNITENITDNKELITYKGQDGITALAILKQTAKVEMSGTGEMAFVTSINGRSANSTKNEYWAFNINGQVAEVGAGSYITKNNETITWKLSSF